MAPLTELLRINSFVWNLATIEGFAHLKMAMINTPVLVLPNFEKTFVVQIDASATGVGAILSQEGHHLAFFNEQMLVKLQASSTYFREMFAITKAICEWRQYLLGQRFVIQTDHQSLCSLITQNIQTPEQ